MDSLTQFTLGAGLGVVTLGKRIGYRKAALTGGLLGTVPDLDVFWPFDDPVDAFVQHRGATHSLIVQALVTPLFAEVLVRLYRGLNRDRLFAGLCVFLIFSTHALLDAMTVYGTQLFWPLTTQAFGLGSVFIIDPLYTLPILIIVLWALIWPGRGVRLITASRAALVITTLYLGWSVAAQAIMADRAHDAMTEKGITPERILAIPTPFNTVYWRMIAVADDEIITAYGGLFHKTDSWHFHKESQGQKAIGCALVGLRDYGRLATFTDGFYQLSTTPDGLVTFQDLRMGLPPDYVFRFALAQQRGEKLVKIPPQRIEVERGEPGDWAWLEAGIFSKPIARPAELTSLWTPDPDMVVASRTNEAAGC